MSKSVAGSASLSSGTTSSIPSEVEEKERRSSEGKAAQFFTGLFSPPSDNPPSEIKSEKQSSSDSSSKSAGSGHARQRSSSAGAVEDPSPRKRTFSTRDRITKASSRALPLLAKEKLAAAGEPTIENVKSLNDSELRILMDTKAERMRGGAKDPIFVSLIEESMRRRLKNLDLTLGTEISANLERTTVMVGMDDHTFSAIEEENFDEKCQEFLKLLKLFSSAVTMPGLREQIWGEIVEVWNNEVANARTKEIDNKSFQLCLKKFFETLSYKEEYHRSKLLQLLLSFQKATYLTPTEEITALFDVALQQNYTVKNIRLKFLLEEEITLIVRWEIKIENEGLLIFSHTLDTTIDDLPSWKSSIKVEFKADEAGDSEVCKYLILSPLRRSGLTETPADA